MAPRLGLFLIWAGASVFQQLHPVNAGEGGEMD